MSKRTPEQIKFLMRELSCFDSDDIESDDFEIAFEDEQGVEGFATCSIVRLAESAFLYMDQIEQQRNELFAILKLAETQLDDYAGLLEHNGYGEVCELSDLIGRIKQVTGGAV